MPTEKRFVIVKPGDAPGKFEFLAHSGHAHFWTGDQRLAMEYTKEEVAEALANKNGGKVKPL